MENNMNVQNNVINIDYDSAKNGVLRDLESLVYDELTQKVNDLNGIVDNIQKNWQGVNAEKFKGQITAIVNAISDFKKNCLDKNLQDINTQIDEYKNNEEIG